MIRDQGFLTIDYTNHRGERGERKVIPLRLWWGMTKWHQGEAPQFLLDVHDLEKQARRTFAIKDCHNVTGPLDKWLISVGVGEAENADGWLTKTSPVDMTQVAAAVSNKRPKTYNEAEAHRLLDPVFNLLVTWPSNKLDDLKKILGYKTLPHAGHWHLGNNYQRAGWLVESIVRDNRVDEVLELLSVELELVGDMGS